MITVTYVCSRRRWRVKSKQHLQFEWRDSIPDGCKFRILGITFLIHRWHDFYSKENINSDEFLSFFLYIKENKIK